MSGKENKASNAMVLNIIIGIAAVSVIVWLVTHCPTCH